MAQFARPDADLAVGTWTASGGGVRYANVDETVASDADYITTPTPPGSATCDLSLSDVTDPSVDTGHVLRWRAGKFGALGTNPRFTIELRQGQGGTIIASQATTYGTDETYANGSKTLTGAEAAVITNYAALTVRLIGDLGDGVTDSSVRVSWLELELPDALLRGRGLVGVG